MNLMCPARLILVPPGSTAELTGHRLAMIYAGPAAAEPAAVLGTRLAVPVSLLPELAASPGESDVDAVRRSNAVLDAIADLHRGETVVVVTQDLSPGFDLTEEPLELDRG